MEASAEEVGQSGEEYSYSLRYLAPGEQEGEGGHVDVLRHHQEHQPDGGGVGETWSSCGVRSTDPGPGSVSTQDQRTQHQQVSGINSRFNRGLGQEVFLGKIAKKILLSAIMF